MTENMKKFLEKVSADKALAEKSAKMDKESLLALAKELGVELTEADFVPAAAELSEDELNTVTGGASVCMCVAGGGGTRETLGGELCACVLVGAGGKEGGSDCFCACALTGYGDSC